MSYTYIDGSIGTAPITHTYRIVDTEFVAETTVLITGEYVSTDMLAVIETYEMRELPVAYNLLRAMQRLVGNYGARSMQDVINTNRMLNPKWKLYEEELNKYMVLL